MRGIQLQYHKHSRPRRVDACDPVLDEKLHRYDVPFNLANSEDDHLVAWTFFESQIIPCETEKLTNQGEEV